MLKKILKILLFFISGLVTILLLLIILIGSGSLNRIIARQIVRHADGSINGEISIGSIDGSVFSHFIINDIIISAGPDTMLTCRSIELGYDLKQLLKKNLDVRLLGIYNVHANLKQEPDSSWNIAKILKESNKPADTAVTATSWKVTLGEFRLHNLSATIAPLDTGMIPSSIAFDMLLKGSFSSAEVYAELDSLKMKAENPGFQVRNMTATILKKGNDIQWKKVNLELNNTNARSEGQFNTETDSVSAELEFLPLALEDFAPLLKGFSLYGNPEITLRVSGDKGKYDFSLGIDEKNQKVEFSGKLGDMDVNPTYSAVLSLTGLDGSYWTHKENLKSDISGKMEISGNGFDVKSNNLDLKGRFGMLRYSTYALDNLSLNILKKKDKVTGRLTAGAFIGDADIRFALSDIFDIPAYDLTMDYSGINAGKLPGMDSLNTNLKGTLKVKGAGVSPADIDAEISVESYDSEINNKEIGDFTLFGSYDRGSYNFKLPRMTTPFFNLNADGSGDVKNQNHINFTFEPFDLYSIGRYFGMPPVSLSGKISGNLTGPSDSLNAKLNLVLEDIIYDSIEVKRLNAGIDARILKNLYAADIQLATDSLSFKDYRLKSADITASVNADTLTTDLRINVSDSLSAGFSGSVEGFSDPLVKIHNLEINYPGASWRSKNDSASVKLGNDAVTINNFGLESGDQSVSVNGKIAFKGDENATLNIHSFRLQSLPSALVPYDLAGTVSAFMSLKGTSILPVIEAGVNADSIAFNGYVADSFDLKMNYDKELFSADGSLLFGHEQPLEMTARVPVMFSLSDTIKLLKDNPGLFASVKINNADLKRLSSLVPLKNISVSGMAGLQAEVKNSMNNPLITGSFNLTDGAVKSREIGIDYRNIQVSALVDSQRLSISKFTAESGKGSLDISGSISLDSRDSLNSKDLAMNINANNFEAIKSANAELNFNSGIDMTGSFAEPKMKGNVRINNSKVNIDYFTSKFSQKKDDPNPPLLEEAIKDTVHIAVQPDTTSGGISGASLIRNMKGELLIDIPGNTWITGKDMNFELEGNLRAVKSSPDVNLFGELNIRRGNYNIYGRRFEFSRGTITFTGGAEFNPELDLEIVYRFRDIEKNMRDLKLDIKGKLLQPQYAFMLDNEAIEEKDAISYIAFGKSINQLGEGEKQKMSGQDLALGAAVTQLSSVLKGVLQEEAGVDVFEFSGGEDWKSGNVTIGKYITNRLYLSYERNFDFDRQRKTAVSEKIMLEYQIFRKLLLKVTNQDVNSGFDLVWKKTWK